MSNQMGIGKSPLDVRRPQTDGNYNITIKKYNKLFRRRLLQMAVNIVKRALDSLTQLGASEISRRDWYPWSSFLPQILGFS